MSKSRQSKLFREINSADSVSHDSADKSNKGSTYHTSMDDDQLFSNHEQSDPPNPDDSEIITVRLSQDESHIVPVSVQGTQLQGVLDCGAGACIIRKEIYESLDPRPPIIHRIYLHGSR